MTRRGRNLRGGGERKAEETARGHRPPPEFSRIVDVTRLGHTAHAITIEANAAECAALARRFGLVSLDRLSAALTIQHHGDNGLIELSGRFFARLRQACVITLDPVPADIDQPIRLFYGEAAEIDGTIADPLALEDDAEPLDHGRNRLRRGRGPAIGLGAGPISTRAGGQIAAVRSGRRRSALDARAGRAVSAQYHCFRE